MGLDIEITVPKCSTRNVASATLYGEGRNVWPKLHICRLHTDDEPNGDPSEPLRSNRARGPNRVDRPAPRCGQVPPLRRTRGRCVDRLHGPRQFRDQHPGRRSAWLHAVVGRGAGQCHRHVVPGALGQTGASSPVTRWQRCAASISPARWSSRCGSRARWRRWQPIWPSP